MAILTVHTQVVFVSAPVAVALKSVNGRGEDVGVGEGSSIQKLIGLGEAVTWTLDGMTPTFTFTVPVALPEQLVAVRVKV